MLCWGGEGTVRAFLSLFDHDTDVLRFMISRQCVSLFD